MKRSWQTVTKRPVKNADLWKRLDEQVVCYSVHWVWVKGHAGNEGNEPADQLANKGVDSL